jgi:serine-type D-Ala-D-Ala carboxypeptidase/endopeptidase
LLYPDLHFGVIMMTNECGYNSAIQDKLYQMGAGIQLDENDVNNWAYALLRRGEKQKALAIFKLNTTLHPQSWNAYDSEAEGFEDTGDTANAIACYKRSLELNPNNTNAVDHLKKLQK